MPTDDDAVGYRDALRACTCSRAIDATQLGAPCSAMYEDASNAQITMFGTENATLPTNHTLPIWRDVPLPTRYR
ncbi:MAG TPA: hypothetical protein VMB20_11575 [Candidatus Acidoferrum sp.]|nr:hypothetical protein [Candidatus Acidoferrum sp.]